MGLVGRQNLFLAVFILCVCTFSAYADSVSSETSSKGMFSNSGFLSNSPDDPGKLDDSVENVFSRMLLAIVIVIILGAATIYASKKVLPKLSHCQGKKIKIVETIHLGSRKAIHLLQVADRQILIGSTPDRITKLADIFSDKDFPLSPSGSSGVDE